MSALATRGRAARGKPQAQLTPLGVCRALAAETRGFLEQAMELDDALERGDTLRLSAQAVQVLGVLDDDGVRTWTEQNLADQLFDAETLIRAAATTATDVISPVRWALLDRAYLLVDTAISSLGPWESMEPCGLGERPSQEPDILTPERREIIRQATVEVMDWVLLIELARDHETFDSELIGRLQPQILRRIKELGSIVLSGMGDFVESTEKLGDRLDGGALQ